MAGSGCSALYLPRYTSGLGAYGRMGGDNDRFEPTVGKKAQLVFQCHSSDGSKPEIQV